MPESPIRSAIDQAAVDPSARALISLFAGPLASVRFPDVDRETLEALAATVERAALEVESARSLLAAAEAELDARRAELLARAHRAKAYARVYAEGNVELESQLDTIALPRPGTRLVDRSGAESELAPRKRGRPRKNADDGTLFEATPAEDVAPDSAELAKRDVAIKDGRAA